LEHGKERDVRRGATATGEGAQAGLGSRAVGGRAYHVGRGAPQLG
jgi:hypothetical protein